MEMYVVRQAIKDLNDNIIGYELLFENEKDGAHENDSGHAAVNAIVNFLEQNGKRMFEDKTAFITFVPSLLFKNIPKMFNENKIVIQIDENSVNSPSSYDTLMKYKKNNYRIAVKDFRFEPGYFALLGVVDYLRLNFGDIAAAKHSYENIIKTAKGFKKECIAYGVDTKESYDLAVKMGADYLEGTYIDEKISERINKVDYIYSNFFRLVVEITKEDPSFSEIEAIVSMDVRLTYSLFRLVNSAYFAMKNKASSILQAIVVLGINGLKQWVYLLSFREGEKDLREDLIKTSFLRANFCSELLAYTKITEISKSEAYLMGMFSTLGALMSAPLEDLLAEIEIPDEIKAALLYKEGPCGELFSLVLSYEKADWGQINEHAGQLGIPKGRIAQIYFTCIETVNATWAAYTATSTNA